MNPLDLKSWVEIPPDSDFPLFNLPFGIFKPSGKKPRPGVALGEYIIDLSVLAENGHFKVEEIPDQTVFNNSDLNSFISLGKKAWARTRLILIDLFERDSSLIRDDPELRNKVIFPQLDAEMLLPVNIGDYTDFYSSMEHATNVGIMFRGKDNALMPNWKHLPVGYHGRSGSIVTSGTDIHRPKGQTKADDAETPSFGPSRLMDFELEMGFIVGKDSKLGQSISTEKAEDYIFGMALFNDWSARDIQKWEYVPLGPFLGKSFGSSLSPWIVTLDALDLFRVNGPLQDPTPLPYLHNPDGSHFDIKLEVGIQPEGKEESVISRSNFKYLYWSIHQQLAHQTINGCNVRVGDLYASGTISGPTEDSYGSMLELSWKGTKTVKLKDGDERKFIQDGDIVIMRGYCEKNGVRMGFGEVSGKILPALENQK
jgi:fumarylacetoacetase